ncbi:CU044_2847 family protein [Streptomyces sp. NPDC055078]
MSEYTGPVEYVQVRTEDGDWLPFETAARGGAVPAAGRLRHVADYAEETIEQGVDRIRTVARTITTGLAELPEPPGRVEVEIGLRATPEGSLAIARSSSDAHIKVTMEWRGDRLPKRGERGERA